MEIVPQSGPMRRFSITTGPVVWRAERGCSTYCRASPLARAPPHAVLWELGRVLWDLPPDAASRPCARSSASSSSGSSGRRRMPRDTAAPAHRRRSPPRSPSPAKGDKRLKISEKIHYACEYIGVLTIQSFQAKINGDVNILSSRLYSSRLGRCC